MVSKKIPNYGPLWFLKLKLSEILGYDENAVVESALPQLSSELVWKLYFELAQIHHRKNQIFECRSSYAKAVVSCQDNLVWKIWLGGARTELQENNYDISRKLLIRAHQEVPEKMKATVLIEMSRLEEYLGNVDQARYYLRKAKRITSHEWKVFLEAVLLEIRSNEFYKARDEVDAALKLHSTTGRLWAVKIQLTHILNVAEGKGTEEQISVFIEALQNVPKSGEVWCEGARIAIYSKEFSKARRYLDFAVQFTPQYGDSFIEYLRLELLSAEPSERASILEGRECEEIERICINSDPTYGVCWSFCRGHPSESTRQCFRQAKKFLAYLLDNDDSLDIATYFANLTDYALDDKMRFKLIYN